jgi:endonuclease III
MERLRAAYGKPELEPHRAPVDELVLTVLSQNTNDRNRDVAYGRLRERFPDWAAVRDAPQDEIEEAIRPGGLAPTKSKVIQNILRALDGDDLAWLETAPVEEGREYL